MATIIKVGFYSDGYYLNSAIHAIPITSNYATVLARAKDNNKVYKYTKATGAATIFSGKPSTETNTLIDTTVQIGDRSKVFANGVLFTGVGTPGVANTNYINGVIAAGVVAGKQYGNDGLLVTGVFNNRLYMQGTTAIAGKVNGEIYKAGALYTGYIMSDINESSPGSSAVNPAVRNMSSTQLSAINATNWLNLSITTPFYEGGYKDWISPLVNGVYRGEYIYNGVLANGAVNEKPWVSGVLLASGDAIVSNTLFRNGAYFNGTLSAVNMQTTFANTTVTVPSNGLVTFANGVVAHGIVTHGIASSIYYEKGLVVDITGYRNIYFKAGALANGDVNGVTFMNGISAY